MNNLGDAGDQVDPILHRLPSKGEPASSPHRRFYNDPEQLPPLDEPHPSSPSKSLFKKVDDNNLGYISDKGRGYVLGSQEMKENFHSMTKKKSSFWLLPVSILVGVMCTFGTLFALGLVVYTVETAEIAKEKGVESSVQTEDFVPVNATTGETIQVHRFAQTDWYYSTFDSSYAGYSAAAKVKFDLIEKQNADLKNEKVFLSMIEDHTRKISSNAGWSEVVGITEVEMNGEGGMRALAQYRPGKSSNTTRAVTVFNVSGDKIVAATVTLSDEGYRDDYDQMVISSLEVRI